MRPVWFQYNGSAGIETGDKKFVGIIAQEMQKIASYTVGIFIYQDSLGNKNEYLDYDANAVTYILVNAVKEQQRIIEERNSKIADLESNLRTFEKVQNELLSRLQKLETLTSSNKVIYGLDDSQIPLLEQNAPNGFANQTSIKYFIPSSAEEAVINIYNAGGIKVKSYPIKIVVKKNWSFLPLILPAACMFMICLSTVKVLAARKCSLSSSTVVDCSK